jgi:hypothetical protein
MIGTLAKTQMIEQGGDVGLITADAIQSLRKNNVELATLGILHHSTSVGTSASR